MFSLSHSSSKVFCKSLPSASPLSVVYIVLPVTDTQFMKSKCDVSNGSE